MASLDKERVHLLVAIVQLDVALGTEVIGSQGSHAAPFSAYPASDDLAVVGIAAAEPGVEVLDSSIQSKIKVGYIGEDTLHAQVKGRDSWELWHVDSASKA